MDIWVLEGWKLVVGFVAAALLQEIRWRRRDRATTNDRRANAYERFLAISDLAYSAVTEQVDLQRGLNVWNGRTRLAMLKATKLDERLVMIQEEIAGALAAVRIHGTPEGVAVAEQMFAAVAAPLLQPEREPSAQLDELTMRKAAFLDVVRRESGAETLARAS